MEGKEFLRKWLAAWTGNQPEVLRSFYSPNAFYRDPFYRDGISGEQLLPYFEKLLARNPSWVWEALEIFPTEKGFCLKWQATIPIGSSEVTEVGMDILELRDGCIDRNEVFFDPSRMLAAIEKEKGQK